MWLEDHWDHKFLVWENDPMLNALIAATDCDGSIVSVGFNPTAENMAQYLVEVIGPAQLLGTGCTLTVCRIEETRKCSASYTLPHKVISPRIGV